jgi:predicted O-methyltransferase YrrM
MIKAWLINFLRKLADISIRPYLLEAEEEIRREILAAQYLSPLAGNYIPWSRPALAPSAVATILNDIIMNQRKLIVEFGGGISTIYVARLLAKRKTGRLITIEHDMDWARTLQGMLESEGLSDRVSLVYAPLTDVKYSIDNKLDTSQWYAEEPIAIALGNDKIDLLIVDGPNPTDEDLYSRYPAMPVLLNRLASSYMVLLDDSGRRGERKVIQVWEVLSGIAFKQIGKYSIAMKNSPFKPFV